MIKSRRRTGGQIILGRASIFRRMNVKRAMQWKVVSELLLIAICSVCGPPHLFGQKVSFGVITGAQLTDDFRSLACPDLAVSQLALPSGCPRVLGAAISVSNASRRFIIGPKLDLRFSPSLSVEVGALHREIRSHETTTFTFTLCPPDQYPDCRTLVPTTHSATITQFTWEFPVLGRYRMISHKLSPFIEGGSSFRPAENREQIGITAGSGVELRLRTLRLTPGLRYTHWGYNGKYVGANQNQVQFVLGIDGPESTEPISGFGYKVSLGVVAGLALTDGLRTRSYSFSNTLGIDPATGGLAAAGGTVIVNSNRTSPVVGIVTEIAMPKHISMELVGLYRPLNARDIVFSNGVTSERRFTVLTWEFPLLVKYKLPIRRANPFLELGPSFRASGNLNGANPSRHGITTGIGIELRQRGITIEPTLRFTHWAADSRAGVMTTHPNQVELVFSMGF